METTIERRMVWHFAGPVSPWRTTLSVVFHVVPIAPEVAMAHLTFPDHYIVVASPRGPKGGWPVLRYLKTGDKLPKTVRGSRDFTCHLALGAWPIGGFDRNIP